MDLVGNAEFFSQALGNYGDMPEKPAFKLQQRVLEPAHKRAFVNRPGADIQHKAVARYEQPQRQGDPLEILDKDNGLVIFRLPKDGAQKPPCSNQDITLPVYIHHPHAIHLNLRQPIVQAKINDGKIILQIFAVIVSGIVVAELL